jgi:hypothetical protein
MDVDVVKNAWTIQIYFPAIRLMTLHRNNENKKTARHVTPDSDSNRILSES